MKPALPWVNMVKLEKERDLIGMYLSGHPLDPYYIELNYGCSMTLKDFAEEPPVEGKEITLGGRVTDFTKKMGKSGYFGILKIEDYTGSSEFMLFGKDFINFSPYGIPDTSIIIRGRYARRFANSDLRFQINSISLLEEVKGKLVNGITLSLKTEHINESFHSLIKSFIAAEEDGEPVDLNFHIHDSEMNRSVNLSSNKKITVSRKLLNSLSEMNIEFELSRV